MIEQVGKYKVIRLIGEGGMSAVYEAEHEMLGNKVAIKVLNPILSSNEQIRTRFKNEAKLMATLNHPNITKVIDFDDQPQQLSIIMEFLEGEDLSERIKKHGSPSDAEIGNIFNQTLSAFDYAHQKGIVHRDIKPSNIFLLPNGSVKVLDFGIAKLYAENQEMTQTGTQMGTPIYMSPEQVKADKTIDLRSDIYSLGVTLFFTVNGKPPYDGSTTSQFDIFNKIVFEPLPGLQKQSIYEPIIVKACAKDRNDRFQNCQEFAVAIENLKVHDLNNSSEKTIIASVNNSEKTQIETSTDNPFHHPNTQPTTPTENTSNSFNSEPAPKNKSKLIVTIVIIALIVVAGVLAFVMMQRKKSSSNSSSEISVDSTNIEPVSDSSADYSEDYSLDEAYSEERTPTDDYEGQPYEYEDKTYVEDEDDYTETINEDEYYEEGDY